MAAVCIDCKKQGITTNRAAKGRPLLCATHRRERRNARRTYNHEKHIGDIYGISSDEYWKIHQIQGGKCYLCRRATGARKKLSVDHCHSTGRVRGLLCTACNRNVLGHARDDPEFFLRAIGYLKNPPAFAVIGERVVPNHEEKK